MPAIFAACSVASAAIVLKSSTVNLLLGGKDGSLHDQIAAITCASKLEEDVRTQDVKTLPAQHNIWQGAWMPQDLITSTITARTLTHVW